ncbi:germination protein, Ger(x)C family [Lentibacillus persicus]|uniref:Germination protein, Ger(X)C family n=1 Tax=Lentibacillus persicus TaxID=640948 RepID=A0A1I2AW64_9BACI|nr:Ger(x)C family spore germination protein [Lentibacillus persicus]SFE47967.1 germination protein, Ger(x)C family [Lentibacillus persicus]
MITKRLGQLILLLGCLIFTAGCWDQRLFKEAQLVLSGGTDLTDSGKISMTVSLPYVRKSEQGMGEESVQIISAHGNTPREARMNIDKKIPGNLDASKMKVVVLGKKVTEQKIYPVLDVFYRNPKSNLSALLAVAEGPAKAILSKDSADTPKVSDYLRNLLKSAETSSIIPTQNIQDVFSVMFDPGKDFMLPLLSLGNVDIENSINNIKGLAIFSGEQYTGEYLTPEQGVLFQLMDNNKGRRARLTKKISENRDPEILNYITIDVNTVNSRMDLKVSDNNEITVDLTTDLTVKAIEYPKDQLTNRKEFNKLNESLSKSFTQEADKIIQKLQEANSDALGIGRKIIAFHHDTWEALEWEETYPEITINTKVNVELVQRGIIH